MNSDKKTARITGALYLLVIICAGFAQGAVREVLFIAGDPAETLENITGAQGLFRIGLVTDLIAFMTDVVISVLLYVLLKDVNKTVAMTAAAFRLIAHPAIGSLNLLNHYMVLELINGGFGAGPEQIESGISFLMTAHNYGYIIAGAFFGVHCFLLGWLLFRSSLFPRVLGVLLTFSAVGYLMESFGVFLFPGNEDWLALVVGITAALGEVVFALYLVIKGVKV